MGWRGKGWARLRTEEPRAGPIPEPEDPPEGAPLLRTRLSCHGGRIRPAPATAQHRWRLRCRHSSTKGATGAPTWPGPPRLLEPAPAAPKLDGHVTPRAHVVKDKNSPQLGR